MISMLNNISGSVLILVALGLVVGSVAAYWPKVKALRVPLRPVGYQAAMVLGMLLALMGLVKEPGLLSGMAASLAVLAGGSFLFVTLTSRLPDKFPSAAVGQLAPDFTARDSDGKNFTLSSLEGRTVLLKFFRGYW
jgi:uncharacterized membrane protein YhhN